MRLFFAGVFPRNSVGCGVVASFKRQRNSAAVRLLGLSLGLSVAYAQDGRVMLFSKLNANGIWQGTGKIQFAVTAWMAK